ASILGSVVEKRHPYLPGTREKRNQPCVGSGSVRRKASKSKSMERRRPWSARDCRRPSERYVSGGLHREFCERSLCASRLPKEVDKGCQDRPNGRETDQPTAESCEGRLRDSIWQKEKVGQPSVEAQATFLRTSDYLTQRKSKRRF